MRGFRTRSSVEDARALIDVRVSALAPESVALADAAGRVLAESVTAAVDVPSFDRAAMDGYAVKGEETFSADGFSPATFAIIGRSRPGRPFDGAVESGQAVEIATGAAIPRGADAVAKAESARRSGSIVSLSEPTPPGRNVGRAGEDVKLGTLVFEPGRRLRPQDLGVLSALGYAYVSVVRRARVAVLVTGEELLPPGSAPVGTRIADMNSPMLAALICRDGGLPSIVGPLPDDRDLLRSSLLDALATSDLVLISGGSSTGPEDFAPSIVSELGELPIHGIALRPASPTGIGLAQNIPILLMPGNPVSSLCAYDFFAGRVVRRLGGLPADWNYRSRSLPLGEKLSSVLGRVDYARVRIEGERVFPLATGGASILSGASRADGFTVVPASSEGLPEGETVLVWLYEG